MNGNAAWRFRAKHLNVKEDLVIIRTKDSMRIQQSLNEDDLMFATTSPWQDLHMESKEDEKAFELESQSVRGYILFMFIHSLPYLDRHS